jgi:hypothetical protein
MHDIFISYAHEDRSRIAPFVLAFENLGWTVFWDERLTVGAEFQKLLDQELKEAKVALIFWSEFSTYSSWVLEETVTAQHLGKLFPLLLDDDFQHIALGYRRLDTLMLTNHAEPRNDPNWPRLADQLGRVIGMKEAFRTLSTPKPSQPVTSDNLTLIHTSWRTPEWDIKKNDGMKYYRIEVIVFGERSVLNRIEKVTYYLDKAYPKNIYEITDRVHNFRLRELANGYSIIKAGVKIIGQPELVQLSRFINLTETGPRLDSTYMT